MNHQRGYGEFEIGTGGTDGPTIAARYAILPPDCPAPELDVVLGTRAARHGRVMLWRGRIEGAGVALALIGGMVFGASKALAAPPQCDTVERVTAVLSDSYGESLRTVGLAGGNAVMGLYASDSTGTWTITITITLPDGQMCLMASGVGFVVLPQGDPT